MRITIEISASDTPVNPYLRFIWFTSRKGVDFLINNSDGGQKAYDDDPSDPALDGSGPFPTKKLGTVNTSSINVKSDHV